MSSNGDFSRQEFLGADSADRLAALRVAIVGLGGGGSHIAQQLAHIGIGECRLIDPQKIEASNLNRLVGATQADVDNETAKVEIARRVIKDIRPWIKVETAEKNWQDAIELIADSHAVVGCVDGYQQRAYLEGAARRYRVPYIDIGMGVVELKNSTFAVSGQAILSLPGKPCMRCIGFLTPKRLSREENDYGAAGINPQVVWTNGSLASLAVGMLMKLVTPWFPVTDQYAWLELDGNDHTVSFSRQPEFTPIPDTCPHHGGPDGLGDPFFSLAKAKKALLVTS